MTFKSPTIEEVEAYIREKNWFLVDAKVFWDYYDANEWHDKGNTPVKRWKGRVVTWHYREKRQLESRGVKLSCRYYGCKGIASYCIVDDTGQKTFWCIDHNPAPKPLPKELVPVLKVVPPIPRVNVNDARNRNMNALRLRKK